MKIVLATVLAMISMNAARSATVVNGNFESVSASPTYTAGAGYMTNGLLGGNVYGYGNTGDGNAAGYISSGYNLLTGSTIGSISFQLTGLTIGQAYQISFIDAASSFALTTANPITVAYNGATIGSFTPGSTSWTSGTTNVFSATNTAGSLTFTGSTVGFGGATRSAGIDAVTIATATGTAVMPEPATWAMMVGGFGMVGGALRRHRATLRLA